MITAEWVCADRFAIAQAHWTEAIEIKKYRFFVCSEWRSLRRTFLRSTSSWIMLKCILIFITLFYVVFLLTRFCSPNGTRTIQRAENRGNLALSMSNVVRNGFSTLNRLLGKKNKNGAYNGDKQRLECVMLNDVCIIVSLQDQMGDYRNRRRIWIGQPQI